MIYNKINERVDIMINDGLEQEVLNLKNLGITRENQSVTSIGYREWFDYFEGKISKQEVTDLIKQHTRNYCKRQLTFLKTIKCIELLDKDQAKKRSDAVTSSAKEMGADFIITACPLCKYNLTRNSTTGVEIKYFTEVIAEALGIKE